MIRGRENAYILTKQWSAKAQKQHVVPKKNRVNEANRFKNRGA